MYVVRKHEEIVEQLREFGVSSDAAYDNLPEGEGETVMYLRDLIKAILEVEDHYYQVEYEEFQIAGEDLYERAFAYELYHQWSKYVECYRRQNPKNIKLCINGEIKKCFWDEEKLPDLVLHKHGEDCQELIVEIKRAPRADGNNITTDIQKLCNFTCGRLEFGERRINNNFAPYSLGVFILTGATLDTLVGKLSNKLNELNTVINSLDEVNKQILCLCIPRNGTVEYATVHEVKHWVERL